jgi:hypothetical protein
MRGWFLFVIATLMIAFSGCTGSEPPTPAQVFDASHGGKTITPHGMVVSGSSRDLAEGGVQYQTDDGRVWRVQVRPDGSYGAPEELK